MNPEELINYTFVDTKELYQQMLPILKENKILQLDSETVGKSQVSLFIDQKNYIKELDLLLKHHSMEDIEEGIQLIDEAKKLVKDLETHWKETLNTTSLKLTDLPPEVRALLQERRKYRKQAEEDFIFAKTFQTLEKKINAFQKKIDADKTGLIFHRNILGLVQIGTFTEQFLIDPKVIDEQLKDILETRTCIIGMNLKFDMLQLRYHLNINLFDSDVICYDIMLADKVLNSGRVNGFKLKDIALRQLGYEQDKEEQLSYWIERPLRPEQIKYACLDVITPGLIFKRLKTLLRDDPDLVKCTEQQMKFLKILTKMEWNGIYVDLKVIENIVDEVNEKANEMRQDIADELGDEVWWNPEKESYEIKLNKDLGSPKETLKQIHNYGKKHNIIELQRLVGTGKDAFEEIEEYIPIVEKITKFRSLLHTRNNYCENILEYHLDSRIHSSYVQIQKEGTRMSSKSPNMQNMPNSGEWNPNKETFEEALLKWSPTEKLRTGIVAAPGKKIFDADYGAIELVGVAYYSQDETMVKALQEGVDLHCLSANQMYGFGYTYEDLKNKDCIKEFKIERKKERHIGKTFNFIVVYGGGKFKIQKQLFKAEIYNVPIEEIQEMREAWYDLFPGVKTWQDSVLHVVKHMGFVTTLKGRNIYFNDQYNIYSKAFNTPIQASCFEGLVDASIIFDKKVRELESDKIPKDSILLTNLIHDEKFIEVDNKLNDESVNKLITSSMLEGMQPLFEEIKDSDGNITHQRVPVTVDCRRVDRWSDK